MKKETVKQSIFRHIDRVHSARSDIELEAAYDKWAEDYDRDSRIRGGIQPALVSELFERYVTDLDARILDAGAGTGIVGEILDASGYNNLIGIDASEQMLKVANSKNVYKALHKMIVSRQIDFEDNYFNAVISSGMFTKGHALPESFDELIRITKPGGHIVFSVNTNVFHDLFEKKQAMLEDEKKWRLMESTEPIAFMSSMEPNIKALLFAYQVL